MKSTKASHPPRQAVSDEKENPDPQEVKTLVALFAEGRYAEAATLARAMTLRFPRHGFGWKALGAVLGQMGHSADALIPLQTAVALYPADASGHNNLGNILRELGRLLEAEACFKEALWIKPDYVEAYSNLANTLYDLDQLDEAVACYRKALQLKPDVAEVYSNLGVALRDLGRPEEAEAGHRRALQMKPDFAEAHCNLGNILKDVDRLHEAEASYRNALQIDPRYAVAHNNLGATLRLMGKLDEAEAAYRRALQLKPDYVEAYRNLGITLWSQDRLGAAEASYQRALQIKPNYVDALNGLVSLLNAQGRATMALASIKQSLQINESAEARWIFVDCVKRLSFTRYDREIATAMARALTEPWDRPGDLARISIDLAKLEPEIAACVARAAAAWPVRLGAQDLFGANGLATITADPLLSALLISVPVCDRDMERFLTMARCAMLEAAAEVSATDAELGDALTFCSALARQCFINEYVFSRSDEEIHKAQDLRDALVRALEAKAHVPTLWPLAVAAYFPLCELPFAAGLLEVQFPETVATVLQQQLREPEEEAQLRSTIPRLTKIEDQVSVLVQNQYEENPYPRWLKAAPGWGAQGIVAYLCDKFPQSHFARKSRSGSTDILVAGCGTGQHSIETAQKFLGARLLAVDLSLSSLAYAKRKTRELGLASIEYAQADLLALGSLDRSFDVVECSGVLHHLGDPLAGWRVLLSLLRPGGFMRVGLYSEIARRNIVRIRNFIAERGYAPTADDIRRCRQDLLDLDKSEQFGNVLESPDFFSTSACRDLLLHVQEHRMTLDGIKVFLDENNLTFLGFEIANDVFHAYRKRFPDDRVANDLQRWQDFEQENPDTFLGMYQFWVQKPG